MRAVYPDHLDYRGPLTNAEPQNPTVSYAGALYVQHTSHSVVVSTSGSNPEDGGSNPSGRFFEEHVDTVAEWLRR